MVRAAIECSVEDVTVIKDNKGGANIFCVFIVH